MSARIIVRSRCPGKTEWSLDESIEKMKKLYPDSSCLAYVCKDLKRVEKALKNHPNVIRKGRWFYYKCEGKLIYIKIIEIKEPKEFKTLKARTITDNKLVAYNMKKELEKLKGYRLPKSEGFTIKWGHKWALDPKEKK